MVRADLETYALGFRPHVLLSVDAAGVRVDLRVPTDEARRLHRQIGNCLEVLDSDPDQVTER